MTNVVMALKALKKTIVDNIADYLPQNNELEVPIPEISEKNVLIENPDIDKLPYSVTVYLVPDYSSLQNFTTCSITSSDTVKVWIFCKRDKQENLIGKSVMVYSAILQTILNNRTLGKFNGVVDFQSADFYPSISATNTLSGYELTLSIRYPLSV